MKVCPECGEEMDDDAEAEGTCAYCGFDLKSEEKGLEEEDALKFDEDDEEEDEDEEEPSDEDLAEEEDI